MALCSPGQDYVTYVDCCLQPGPAQVATINTQTWTLMQIISREISHKLYWFEKFVKHAV